jgi:dehydrogenase/reductase SDR family protein 1
MGERSLAAKVAVVTGASRGVGKGIAEALGDAGATVYVTGRTQRDGTAVGSLTGNFEDTAEEVTRRGGAGIAVRCDHRDDESVRALFATVARDHGRLDILVNNAWGGYESLHEGAYEQFGKRFWEQPVSVWDDMFVPGVRGQYVASAIAVPLLIAAGGGLIVNVSSFAGTEGDANLAYAVAKATTDRTTAAMASQLRDHEIAVVALYPGLVRTEGILKWKDYLDLSNSESPELVGRAVVALARDPELLERSGKVQVVAELAEELGFTDVDGTRPRSLRRTVEV